MGYSYSNNGQIKNFWPDNDDKTIYIVSAIESLADIILMVRQKWPDATLDDVRIEAKNIHTSCLTYDQHDSSDYTEFLVITLES